MSNDPTKPRWPGQQPTSFDPMTGQPLYGDPQQPPQQQWQQPQQGYPQQGYPQQQQWPQQPPQQQWQQPQQSYPPQQQQWPQQPPQQQWNQQPPQQQYHQQGYPQQPQQPMQPAWGQQPQQAWGGQGQGQHGYAQHNASYPQNTGRPDSDADDDDDDDDSSNNLRAAANATMNQSDRLRFVRLTYLHLFGAILVFAGLLWSYFHIEPLGKLLYPIVKFSLSGRWNWGVVLVAFMAVSWVADYWASHSTSKPMQYVGLGLYVLAESIIFTPLLVVVQWKTAEIIAKGGGNPNILRDAAITTLAIFAALTASVYVTKKDFSFLRSGLMMAGAAATVVVFLAIGFGFNLGIVFSVAMVLLASGYVLYQTSQVFAHYHTESYVAAALALFSSIALMFWYVIRIFMRMRE